MARRRWFNSSYAPGFGVSNGPTRYGNVTYTMTAAAAAAAGTTAKARAGTLVTVTVSADFHQTKAVHQPEPTLMVRVRDPAGGLAKITKATAAAVEGGGVVDCEVLSFDAARELVVVVAKPLAAKRIKSCRIVVVLTA